MRPSVLPLRLKLPVGVTFKIEVTGTREGRAGWSYLNWYAIPQLKMKLKIKLQNKLQTKLKI